MSDAGQVAIFLVVCSLALAFAELQYRQEASSRWFVLAITWVIAVGMLIWCAYG